MYLIVAEAAVEQISRVERKTKPKWMNEDIFDIIKKGGK